MDPASQEEEKEFESATEDGDPTSGIVPDALHSGPKQPVGAQAVPASGFVEAKELRGAATGRRFLTKAELEKMGAAEIRAVSHDRGYEIGTTRGARSSRVLFAEQQDADSKVEKPTSAAPTE
jgi:hypothetical protein